MVHGHPHFNVSNITTANLFPFKVLIVHMDLCGPKRQATKRLLIFHAYIDDFSCKVWSNCFQLNLTHSLSYKNGRLVETETSRFEKSNLRMVVSLFHMPSIRFVPKEILLVSFLAATLDNKME